MQAVERLLDESEGDVKFVGSRIRRVEDLLLLTGHDQYVDNLKFSGMAFAGFVRSPYPHARIKQIDVSNLLENPSVVAVLTPEEVRESSNPVPVIWRAANSRLHEHYALAQEKVKHVGDPVLAVAVKDRNELEDILDSVNVEYEELKPVLDPSVAEEQSPIHEELGSNLCVEVPISKGDVEKAIEGADLVVTSTFTNPRLAASPMENRGVIAVPKGLHGSLEVYSSTQWPHVLRTFLARCLKIPESKLRVIAPDVGGAFGVKGEVFAEEIAIPMLALKSGLPVKWIESRKESFVATTHARGLVLEATASFTKDGVITGLKVKFTSDLGAYLHTITPGCAVITAISLNGPYKIPNFSVVGRGVYTNKVSLSAYRGFGQPEAAFVLERLMTIASRKLGMDPTEIRFKNMIQPEEMPYRTVSGGIYDSGDYPSCLSKALELAEYEKMVSRKKKALKKGELRGVGVSIFTEAGGFAPGFVFEHLGLSIGGFDSASVRMDYQGKATITTGAMPHGQGFNTSLSQICADELSIRIENVRAFHGDTDSSPYGQGSFGSRTMAVAGSAAVLACRKLAKKIREVGAHLLKCNEEDLILEKGYVRSKTNPNKRVSITEIARAAYTAHDFPASLEPGLEATAYFNPIGLTTSYAAHVSEVAVDPETGMVRLVNHIVVHDCGRAINPMIVEGQIQGGLAQAIGASFLEEVVYDENGQLLSGSFLDYLLPTAENMPLELSTGSTTVLTPINPLGAKGVGESSTIIAPASIANAVSDAVGENMNQLPMTPERVRGAALLHLKSMGFSNTNDDRM